MRARTGTLIAVLLVVASWQFGAAAWIHLRAALAQQLIALAWHKARDSGQEIKPWPWADTWPLARLTLPARGIELYVLAGASGRTLAFGPGHLSGSALPGRPGNTLISAHRDTHFAFLEQVRPGEEVCIETRDGRVLRYRVVHTRVVHKTDRSVAHDSGEGRLTLVTCYPFRAIDPGGPLRYVVSAVRV
jgi:sortase A